MIEKIEAPIALSWGETKLTSYASHIMLWVSTAVILTL
jgi:hypothetical protein